MEQLEVTKLNSFKYDGNVRGWLEVELFNWLYSFITLGIYSFWGKTKIRKYMLSHFSINGDRFEYSGTGKELFFGFLKAVPIVLMIILPFFIWEKELEGYEFLMWIPLIMLYYLAVVASFRYRCSRTSWRGIRARLTLPPLNYMVASLGLLFVNIVTIGFYIPYSDLIKARMIHNNMYFGDTKFLLTGDASKLVVTNIITLLLAIPTLFVSRFWYHAALNRHIYDSMTLDGISFKNNQTGESLFALHVGNFFIYILTFGMGKPWVMNRNMSYIANTIEIHGNIDASSIIQSTERLSKTGEGLQSALGLESNDLDIGIL